MARQELLERVFALTKSCMFGKTMQHNCKIWLNGEKWHICETRYTFCETEPHFEKHTFRKNAF